MADESTKTGPKLNNEAEEAKRLHKDYSVRWAFKSYLSSIDFVLFSVAVNGFQLLLLKQFAICYYCCWEQLTERLRFINFIFSQVHVKLWRIMIFGVLYWGLCHSPVEVGFTVKMGGTGQEELSLYYVVEWGRSESTVPLGLWAANTSDTLRTTGSTWKNPRESISCRVSDRHCHTVKYCWLLLC